MAKFMIKMINSPILIEDGRWTNVDQIFDDYQVTEDDRPYCKIILGYYIYESYRGDSFVLFLDSRDNKLYEVNGSHCSCYGLEGRWSPEETFPEAAVKQECFQDNELLGYLVRDPLLILEIQKLIDASNVADPDDSYSYH